jgi:RNA polymerase sigma-70 factor (ECF subfamily)
LQVHDWQVVVNDHGPAVWQTAYRLLGNHADAADCFQEAFAGALEISRRQEVRNIAGLLVQLATTRAIDRLRQKTRQNRHQAEALAPEEALSRDAGPLDLAQTGELADHLRQAIGRLPPQEAKVFCLRHLSEMSYRQIAKELNVNISVVGVSLYRARARLREALAAVQIEDDEVPHGNE